MKQVRGRKGQISRCVGYQFVWRSGTRDIEHEMKELIKKHALEGSANEGGSAIEGQGAGFAWWNIQGGRKARGLHAAACYLCALVGTRLLPLPHAASTGNLLADLTAMEARYLKRSDPTPP